MAVSRSNPPSGMGGTTTNQTNSSQGVQSTSGASTTTGSSRTNEASRTTVNSITDYLDPTARAALNSILNGLGGGSTGGNRFAVNLNKNKGSGSNQLVGDAKKRDQIRLDEILTNQGIRGDYSKGNAFADAQNAMNAQMTQALQAAMPTITAGIDAAGTSGGALSALLTQQAAEDAAAQAAQLGLQSAIQYGQIQTGLSGVIEGLLGQGSEAANMLMNALGIAKGAYEKTSSTTQNNSSSQTNSSQTTNSNQTTVSSQNSTQSATTVPNAAPSTAKKKTNAYEGYGLLGSPRVTAQPGSAATRSSGTSYSQF